MHGRNVPSPAFQGRQSGCWDATAFGTGQEEALTRSFAEDTGLTSGLLHKKEKAAGVRV